MSFNPQFQKVGDILVHQGVISEDQLQKALAEQKKSNEKLGQILINQGIITEADLVKAYSQQMGHKHVLENDLLMLSEDNVSLLSEIAIYTLTDEVPLRQVFAKIHDNENGGPAISHKAPKIELEEYFFKVMPDYDEDRVYASDIKKIVQWYNLLQKNGYTQFLDASEEE